MALPANWRRASASAAGAPAVRLDGGDEDASLAGDKVVEAAAGEDPVQVARLAATVAGGGSAPSMPIHRHHPNRLRKARLAPPPNLLQKVGWGRERVRKRA